MLSPDIQMIMYKEVRKYHIRVVASPEKTSYGASNQTILRMMNLLVAISRPTELLT